MDEFTQRIVMITGASGNLGGAVVNKFLELGAHLVLIDHGEDRLHRQYPDLADSPDHLLVTGIDGTNANDMTRAVDLAVERFGRIDILVNTVGGFRSGTNVHEMDLDIWNFMLDLNAKTVLVASQAAIPIMLQQNYGKIINIGARPALSGRAKMAAYSVSKSAVLRLTESMAAELKSQGININCIIPGTIDTPENRQEMPEADYSRWVQPASLADVISFLASEGARDIHGASIPVYGRS